MLFPLLVLSVLPPGWHDTFELLSFYIPFSSHNWNPLKDPVVVTASSFSHLHALTSLVVHTPSHLRFRIAGGSIPLAVKRLGMCITDSTSDHPSLELIHCRAIHHLSSSCMRTGTASAVDSFASGSSGQLVAEEYAEYRRDENYLNWINELFRVN